MGFFRLLCALWLFYVLFRVWRTLLQNLPPNPPGDSPFGGAGGRPFGHGPDPFEARPPPPPPPPPPRAPRPPPARSPYDILGVSSQATRGEIKAAYQKLIRQYHPDLVSNLGPELRELAEQRTKEITGAYNALKRS